MKASEIGHYLLKNRYGREILIFLFLALVTFLNEREDFTNDHAWIDGFFIFLLLYLHLQVHRFFILPYLQLSKYLMYTLFTILGILVFTILALSIDYYLTNVGWFDDLKESKGYLVKFYLSSFSITVPLLLAVHSLFKEYEYKIQQDEEKFLIQDMELKLLRAQSNPHFLFNALNSLYGLSLEKPAELPEKILQMAHILRYQIDLSRKEWTSLSRELSFLEQYIDFEADRQKHNVEVSYQIELTKHDLEHQLPPMILIFFVENAFKHVFVADGKGFIKLKITVEGKDLSLYVANTYNDKVTNKNSLKIGLDNVKRRLGLVFNDDYRLEVCTDESMFSISLLLKLR